jgi:hypothetical protein
VRGEGGEEKMENFDIDELRAQVKCGVLLEKLGFAIDTKESTRRAVKFRRAEEIVIVIHEGRGWFDARSDAKGDVFTLARHLLGVGFRDAIVEIADLVAFIPAPAICDRFARHRNVQRSIADRWNQRSKLRRTSLSWAYLRYSRGLPGEVIYAAAQRDILREGPYGSMWAKHADEAGAVIGWEERGPDWRGFATGGSKALFRFGDNAAVRICVTEAAIDALSLAAIEHTRSDTLYVSTGGGWSPLTARALETLAARKDTWIVAATDNDVQGEVFAERLRQMANQADCNFSRLKPDALDWNERLKR